MVGCAATRFFSACVQAYLNASTIVLSSLWCNPIIPGGCRFPLKCSTHQISSFAMLPVSQLSDFEWCLCDLARQILS